MKKYIAIVILIISSVSCKKEIDINVPDTERKIVLNAVVYPDSIFTAYVYRSNHIQDQMNSMLFLNNATVNVYENGTLLDVLLLDNNGFYKGSDIVAEEGHEYEYVVEVSNLQSATAKVKTTNRVPIISIDSIGTTTFQRDDYYNEYAEVYTLCKINFQDNPDTDDYYRIRLEAKIPEMRDTSFYDPYSNDTVTYVIWTPIPYFESQDPSIEVQPYSDDYYYFSDKLFNGKKYGFEFGVKIPEEYIGEKTIYVSLEHISTVFFRYIQSVDLQGNSDGLEIFYQTVQVFNNIENGFGILGTTTICKDSIVMN